jgi:hypothetical protein
MYFRKKTSGGRGYLQIVENRRDGGQVRQQVIATLGRYEDLRESGHLERLLRPDIERKAFGEVRIVRQKIQPFALHGCRNGGMRRAALRVSEQSEILRSTGREPAAPADRTSRSGPVRNSRKLFFERRSRRTIRSSGSPNTPRTVAFTRKPANEYPSDRRRCRFPDFGHLSACQNRARLKAKKVPIHKHLRRYDPQNHPLDSLKTPKEIAPRFSTVPISRA